MDISYISFQVFYKHLVEKILTVLTDKQKQALTKSDASIWDIAKKENLFQEIFGTGDLAKEYLYKKSLDFVPERVGIGVIKDSVIISALKYLGVEIPKGTPQSRYASPLQQAMLLFEEFTKIHEDEISEKDFHSTPSSSKFLEKSYYQEDEGMKNQQNDYQLIEKVINDFYHYVTMEQFDDAWNLLAKKFQGRAWKAGKDEFALGYINTVSCTNVHVWDINVQRDTASCKLYYLDKLNVGTNTLITDIDTLPLSEFERYVIKMREFIACVKETGFEGVEKTEIAKFFQSTVSEYIWVRNNIDPEEIKKLFPRQVSDEVHRLYSITLMKSNSAWFIASITPLKSQLHR